MVRLTPGVIAALTLAVILTISPVLRAVTVDVAPDAEQLTTGTSAGFANLLSDDGLNWVPTEGVAGSSTQDVAPSTETIVTGSKVSGTFTADIDSSNDAYIRYQEADTASNPTDLTADSETLTKANSVSGALSDLNTDNAVSRVVSEADQAVPSDLAPDVETIDKGSASGAAFPQTSDDGSTRDYLEADQTPANYQATLYPNADGYTNAWVTAGTPACLTGASNWYQDVDDGATPDDDATCRQAASNNQIIAVGMQDAAITGSPSDVDVCARGHFEDDVSGANTVRILIRSGTTNSFSGTSNPPAPGAGYTPPTPWYCLDVDPADAGDWTDTDIDAIQIGADTPDANPDPRVTQFEMIVWANYTAGTDYELQVTIDHTGPESCTGTRTLTVNAWRASGATMENVEVYVATSAEAFSTLAFTVTATADGTTYTYVLTDDEWDSGLPNYRFIDTTTSGDSGQGTLRVDRAVITCTVSDFELEYRNAFTGETCAAPNTRVLTVNAWRSTAGMENVEVQVEDGSDTGTYVARITVSQTTDTATQTYALTDPEWDLGDVQIRMLGTSESGDTSQGEFSMDYVVVQCTPPMSYQVEVRYDWTGVSTTGTSWTLIVECKRVANPEDALIQVGTFPGPTWNTRYVCDSNADETFSTYALTLGELNSGAPSVRVLYNATGDASQSSWDLDWVTVRRAFDYYGLLQYHKWIGTVAAADAYQYRVRAFRSDAENFLSAFWDWQDSNWNPTAVTVNAAAETLFTYTPATACAGAADDCERNTGNGTLMVRWIGSSETSSDETQSVLTADQEIVQRTDNAPSLSGAYHIPANPTDAQVVTFRVNYTDTLTCPATYVNVAVDGGLDQAMNEFDPGDTNCADGKIYTYTLGPYAAGPHTYFFNASDGVNPQVSIGPFTFTVTSTGSPPPDDPGDPFYNPARTEFTWELLSDLWGCTFRFISLATIEPFTILEIRWDFPDGTVLYGAVVEHTFKAGCTLGGWWPGAWAVKMTFTDSAFGIRSITKQVSLDRRVFLAAAAAGVALLMLPDEIKRTASWKRVRSWYYGAAPLGNKTTIKRGTVEVSERQDRLLHARRLPHTHQVRRPDGSIYYKRYYA